MFTPHLYKLGRFLFVGVIAVLVSTFLLQIDFTAIAQGQGNQPCLRLEEFKHVQGLGNACRMANGFWKVQLADGSFGYTHGNDDHKHVQTTMSSASTQLAAPSPVTCAPSGTYRALVLYVNPTDRASQYSTRLATMRSYIQQMQDKLNNESMIFGVTSSYRIACDADGQVTVRNVPLSISSAQHDLGAITNDLKAKGYNSTFEKYMIFYEQPSCGGGVAWAEMNDSTDVNNSANRGPSYGVSWGFCGAMTMMHENGHNMGAVMNSAPNTTGAGHCIDDQDVMCYNDGGPRGAQLFVACSDFEHFDCNHNDYFHPIPPSGSYLATHWNIGDCRNRFINRSGCGTTPPTNTPVPPTGTNVARGKAATANSTCAATEGPGLAFDGSTTTKWCGFVSGGSAWLRVDLGANYTVNSFAVRHAGAGGESTSWNTRDFQIQTSTDGTTFSTAVNVTGNTASTTTHNISARSARYVRLWITVAGSDAAARIYEFEVYGSAASANLALNKATTASTICNTNESSAKAVNGSVSGGNSDKWCAPGSSNWMRVDLGANYNLTSFVVKHAGAGGESTAYNTRNFLIETSPDGNAWTQRVSITGNTASTTTHNISAVTARYVRLYITQPEQGTGGAARIYEFEVYGSGPVSASNSVAVPTNTPQSR